MKDVFLHGSVAEGVKSSWKLNVRNPAEAFRAVNINTEGLFFDNLLRMDNRKDRISVLCLTKEESSRLRELSEDQAFNEKEILKALTPQEELHLENNYEEIHIVPSIDGEVVTAVTAIGAAIGSMSVATMAFSMLAPMLVAGIANALFPPVKVTNRQRKSKSYLFGDSPNFVRQGAPVPVGYGFLKVGSSTLGFSASNQFLPGSIGGDLIESYTVFKVQDAISEGPIEGFADWNGVLTHRENHKSAGANPNTNPLLNSIIINDMQVRNEVGDLNLMLNEGDVGTNTFSRPRFSLGDSSDFGSSGVEYEKRAGSPLAGPEVGIYGFWPERNYSAPVKKGSPVDVGKYAGAAPYTYAITDPNSGIITLNMSSDAMYHNWTDKRVRRRFISQRVRVDRGTSPMPVTCAIRFFDGSKYVPPILPTNYKLLEGLVDGSDATSKYYIGGILTSKDRREDSAGTVPATLLKYIVWALFGDTQKEAGISRYSYIYNKIGSAKDFIEKIQIASAAAEVTLYGQPGNLSYFLSKYFDEGFRWAGGDILSASSDTSASASAELIASLFSQVQYTDPSLAKSLDELLGNNFHEIMQVVKSLGIGRPFTLGADGFVYRVKPDREIESWSSTKQYKSGDLVRYGYSNGTDRVYRAARTLPVGRYPGERWWKGRFFISSRLLKARAKRDWAEVSSPGGVERREGHLWIKGISTSPASIDYNICVPYVSKGEAVTMQIMRMTKEIRDIAEMSEKSVRLSLKGIRHHKTLGDKLIKLKYPGTSWIETQFDSVNFQQMPSRAYLVKLKKVAVPENYNSRLGACLGAWNGLFKGQTDSSGGVLGYKYGDIPDRDLEWTENPAWILLDIMLNQRFGVGKHGMVIDHVDVWNLYAVAKFCDELVETGFPLEKPKRKFTTNNKSSIDPDINDAGSYLKNKDRFLSSSYNPNGPEDSFFIDVLDVDGTALGSQEFLEEFNNREGGQCYSAGKYLAFYMDDGSLQRRMIKNIVVPNSDSRIELWGPSFIDHNTTSSEGLTNGTCLLELTYPLVEPRFSMNTYFTEQEEALQVVQEITSAFRAVVNYINGQISFVAEKPTSAALMFADANVSESGFAYSGAPKTSRLTAARVRYIDKFDQFKSKVEYYEDAGGIDKFGFRDQEVVALGCTSRGQAQRLARFMVVAPLLESEVVSFETGLEGAMLLPGSIIEISDSRRFGENINGRVKSVDPALKTVSVDKIMSNLSFYDPVSGLESDRVELCVMVGRGFETVGQLSEEDSEGVSGKTGLYKKMSEMAKDLEGFDADDQMSLISGVRRSQLVYFDGFLSENRRKIESVTRKYMFNVNVDSDIILSEGHGLETGDLIKFVSFGELPSFRVNPLTEGTCSIDGYDNKATCEAATSGGDNGVWTETPTRRLAEGSLYSVVVKGSGAGRQNHSFSIKETTVDSDGFVNVDPSADALDFSDKGFTLRNAVADAANISGGEHFYYVYKKVDGTDVDQESIAQVMPGSVWSIKGYQRQILAESKKIQDSIQGFLTKIGAKSVLNAHGIFYSDQLGKFSLSTYRQDMNLLTVRQSGSLGNLILNTDSASGMIDGENTDYAPSFFGTKLAHMSGTFGSVRLSANGEKIDANYTSAGVVYDVRMYRPRNDSPVVLVISDAVEGQSQSAAALGTDRYKINGISFYTKTYENKNFIKIGSSGIAPSNAEIAHAFSGVDDPTLDATAVVDIGAVETSIDINDFKNVGRRQYRVSSVSEGEYGKYSVKASEYNRDKFDIIEKSLNLNRPTLPIPPQQPMDIPLPPSNLKIKDVTTRNV